jgi:hypothetical protein
MRIVLRGSRGSGPSCIGTKAPTQVEAAQIDHAP